MSFWKELKRRNVYKVGVAYLIAAWLIVQGVAIVSPALQLPKWTLSFVIVILIIGFPLILLFAWAFEITPEGIKRTKEVPLHESITHLTGQKLNYILAGVIVLAVAYIVFDKFYLDRRTIESNQVTVVSDVVKAKTTIAVLPFENLSSDPEQEYFVDGLSEEILNTLARIPDLGVTARTSSFSFKGKSKTVQEIASVLGVDNILEGSVRKAGNSLRITAQLIRAKDGLHLWSDTYDRELKVKDIFAVQEDIAKAVANELKATFGIGKSLKQLGGTDNEKAYELYLIAKGQMQWTNDTTVISRILKSIDAAIAIDPKFALAWAAKAEMHNILSIFVPHDHAVSEQNAALNAVNRAIELEPKLGVAYYELGFIKDLKGDWINAEWAYRKALELQTEKLSNFGAFLAVHYQSVGFIKRAHRLLEEMLQNDPLKPDVRGHYMLSLAYVDNIHGAEEEYAHGMELFGNQWVLGNSFITDIRLGMGNSISSDKILSSEPIHVAIKKHVGSPKDGLAELRRLYNDDSSDFVLISLWAAYFGDPGLAMDAMGKWFIVCNNRNFFWYWVPVMKDVRQMPSFKTLVKKVGLVDYWEQFGWPDICHQLENGDFECD